MLITIRITAEDSTLERVFSRFNEALVLSRNTAENWDDFYDQLFMRVQGNHTYIEIDLSDVRQFDRKQYEIIELSENLAEECSENVRLVG